MDTTGERNPFDDIEAYLREQQQIRESELHEAARRHPANITKGAEVSDNPLGEPASPEGITDDYAADEPIEKEVNQNDQPLPNNVIRFPLRSVIDHDV